MFSVHKAEAREGRSCTSLGPLDVLTTYHCEPSVVSLPHFCQCYVKKAKPEKQHSRAAAVFLKAEGRVIIVFLKPQKCRELGPQPCLRGHENKSHLSNLFQSKCQAVAGPRPLSEKTMPGSTGSYTTTIGNIEHAGVVYECEKVNDTRVSGTSREPLHPSRRQRQKMPSPTPQAKRRHFSVPSPTGIHFCRLP